MHRFTIHFTTSPLHHFTTSPLHHFTASPLHHFTTSPLHHFTPKRPLLSHRPHFPEIHHRRYQALVRQRVRVACDKLLVVLGEVEIEWIALVGVPDQQVRVAHRQPAEAEAS